MTDQQPNAWQNRPRNMQQQPTARTPQQSRSGSITPRGSGVPQAGNQERNTQGNTWTQSETSTNTSKTYAPLNGFNAGEVKAFLRSQASSDSGTSAAGGGTTQSSKVIAMANGQSFFATLAKQVAALESGG